MENILININTIYNLLILNNIDLVKKNKYSYNIVLSKLVNTMDSYQIYDFVMQIVKKCKFTVNIDF